MTKKIRIVIAQINLIVGDIEGNLQKHIDTALTARDTYKADLILFPELSITGYPPEDLLSRKDFIDRANKALEKFTRNVSNIHCLIGHPYATSNGLYNACSLVYNDLILARYAKQHLPNYGVFDEARYFIPGDSSSVISVHGVPIGITICEDLWFPGPALQAANLGARIILSPNASPFEIDKHEKRIDILKKRAKDIGIPIVYANNIGGQDDLVFDGGSMVVDEQGEICQHAGFFKESLLAIDFEVTATNIHIVKKPFTLLSELEKIYQCLVVGVRDYINKNNFPGALIGLSGGIDSALTLAIAVDALGFDKVKAVLMPSRFTAEMSNIDALSLANNLQVKTETISIEPVYSSFINLLSSQLANTQSGITLENLQARCRGVILMALSNASGKIVLTTSNRSEMAVGYTTLYGDMAGGYAVLKDVPKTLVYKLCQYRNTISPIIPQRIIDRPPTAELAYDQKDQDSLPAYDILDKILAAYLDREQSIDEIVKQGFERELVTKIVKLIHRNEYKRRQSAIGTRINHKAFGRDRRYPVTSGFDR